MTKCRKFSERDWGWGQSRERLPAPCEGGVSLRDTRHAPPQEPAADDCVAFWWLLITALLRFGG